MSEITTAPEAWIRNEAERLIESAHRLGFKVEITLQSTTPLAMGGHVETISIRPIRPTEKSDDTAAQL